MKKTTCLNVIILFIFLQPCISQDDALTVDFARKGAHVSPSMYGVFFEEISHAGDGGLYAEMIQNRGFEDKTVPATCNVEKGFLIPPARPNYLSGKAENWKMPWDTINKWPGWSLRLNGAARASMKLTTKDSLNPATPHCMEINIGRIKPKESVELVNSGYWGIAVRKDEKYHLRFYVKADKSYPGNVVAKIRNEEDIAIAKQEFTITNIGTWNEYTCTLTAKKSASKALLILSFNKVGKVWVDFVSLFPEKTFKNRENGLREDVARLIENLKPAFIRWPGGCIAEGLTLDNRVKWKETLGNPVNRPGAFDLWGYRNSYGFGYHEFLQFCEDIGAAGMYVCNAGMACAYRNGDYVPDDTLSPYVQDALDAIEYAVGDTSTEWGKKRAANGHPDSFPLKYIEIGNENYGPIYAKRFNIFYKAIKEKYPQVTIISTLQFDPELTLLEKTDMIDVHYYVQPEWFYRNTKIFDAKRPRPGFNVYVGEYACNKGVGTGNMNAALSEAAFMTGMERNSDLINMCSYAPLIENSNARNWPVNLIQVKNNKAFGRSSYYVQKMFSENRPDINLATELLVTGRDLPKLTFNGLIGLGTWMTQVTYKDFVVKQGENTIYKADFINNQQDWEPTSGHWRVEGDSYIQGDVDPHRTTFVRDRPFINSTIEVKAGKTKGGEGFLILFGASDYLNYYQLNIGGYGNTYIVAEKVEGGSGFIVSDTIPFHVEDNRWYDIRLTMKDNEAECFIDGKSVLKYTIKEPEKRYAIAGFDEKKNEIVIKVVNAENVPFKTSVKIANAGSLEPRGEITTLSADSKTDENSFKKPDIIIPQQEQFRGFSNDFKIEFKPYSLTILRIKRK
jgi:alpha-L-arabinofuranosidase